jgi:hypothetical protein
MIFARTKPLIFLIFGIYGTGLYFFYVRYVPLVNSFQLVLAPVLAVTAILTFADARRGTLFFIFLFPLINNLPYFFNLYEPLPVAPAALVLFLFYFLGWLGSRLRENQGASPDLPIFRPLLFFSVLVTLSGLVTFWRYANFVPFLSDRFYELITNANGVSAGGAEMSVVFFSLNYLTGIAFFFVFFNTFKSRESIRPLFIVVGSSAFIAMLFGLFQRFKDLNVGNHPLSINQGLVNATFKDAMSFSAYLTMIIPLLLGVFLSFKGVSRIFSFLILVLAGGMLFFTGSKIGLLSLGASLLVFVYLNRKFILHSLKVELLFRKMHWSTVAVVLLILVIMLNILVFHDALTKEFSGSQTIARLKVGLMDKTVNGIFVGRADILWKMAVLMIRDFPFTGIGMGSYIIEVSNYAKLQGITFEYSESAENHLLQIWAELGLAGVLLVVWIFWELVRKIRKVLLAVPFEDKERLILTGVISGLVAYFITIQVHTFIGSYEIKYFFWLFAGILFSMNRFRTDSAARTADKPPSGKRSLCYFFLAIIPFGGILLWNSTHALSLGSQTDRLGLKQEFGFYKQEKANDGSQFRWTGEYGGQAIRIEKATIHIPLLASHPDVRIKPVKVKVYIVRDLFRSRRFLGEVFLTAGTWRTFEFHIPEEVGRGVIVLVQVSRTWNPWKMLRIPDPRNLGVAVGKIYFQ